jgi:serine/threonine-protein kinase
MDRVIHIAQQICRSLREAHGLGIIHRDLKPANVILRRQQDDLDFVKVLDFGLVKFFSGPSPGVEITHAGTFMGSPHYIAPEQARNQSPDQRCDIYSLGVLLFHMATGRVPFTAASPVDIILKHLHDPPQPPRELRPDFPQGFEAVILRCLEKDRAARYQSMDELLLALKQARAELGLPAGALSAPPSAGLAASRPGSGPGSGALLAAQVTPAAMATPSASQRLAGPGAGSDAPSITVTRSRPHRAPLEVPTFSSLTERPPLLRPVTLVALGLACSVAVVGYRTGRALLLPPAVPSPQAAIAGPALPAVQPEGGPAPLAPGRLSQGATTPSEVPTALANTTLVTVVSTPAGAAVHDVEDRLLGATPFELRVPSNQPLQLILRAQGFRPGLVRQQTVAGERLTLSVALKREAKQPPSAPPPGRGRTGSYKEDPY